MKRTIYWLMTAVLIAEGLFFATAARWVADVAWWQRALWVLFMVADCAGALTIGTVLVSTKQRAGSSQAGESRV